MDELTETAKQKIQISDRRHNGGELQQACACVRTPGARIWLLCVRGAGGAGSSESTLKLQTTINGSCRSWFTDMSGHGHGHGARREQSSEDDGRLTSGMLLGKSTARGRRRRALDEEEEVEDVGVRTDGRR